MVAVALCLVPLGNLIHDFADPHPSAESSLDHEAQGEVDPADPRLLPVDGLVQNFTNIRDKK